MRLSVAVMAHKKRADLVERLVDRLGIDPEQVVWDRHGDRWDTGDRAWQAHDRSADWHLVLQDDAVVCRDLIPALEKALDQVPGAATMSPYMGKQQKGATAALAAKGRRDVSWVRLPRIVWGVAMAAPVYTIRDMLKWCRGHSIPNYDTRISVYYRDAVAFPAWYTWPSLVDHAQVPSLIGHEPGRRAVQFVGEDFSALEIDWSGRVVDAPNTSIPPSILKENTMAAGDVYVAKKSFVTRIGKTRYRVRGGVTRVREGHPILNGREDLFEHVTPSPGFEVESATAAPGEKRSLTRARKQDGQQGDDPAKKAPAKKAAAKKPTEPQQAADEDDEKD